uniref:Ubiquitously-expressed, prefoldin-like chaperone n=1 Tax=Neogobius melanostomus TaxID=47308 RepID=A0A8C6TCS5_9GOBI
YAEGSAARGDALRRYFPDHLHSGRNRIDQKVLQYEDFINEVLRRDLQKVLDQRDSVYEKISQYLQLKNTLQSLQEAGSKSLKTEVDLGCNFYVQAQVEDASRVFVAVGYGFFTYSHKYLEIFTETLTKDSAKIKAHIRLVLEGLRELQGFSDLPESSTREIF